MEKAQLCKSAYNNQLNQQSIYLCHKKKMSQIWQVNTLWQSQSYRSHHDAHLHPLTNVSAKCQPSTPYGIKEINPDKILKLTVTMTRSKVKSRGHTITLHTYNPQPMSLQSINFLHLTFSKIQPRQYLIGQGHYGKVKCQIKVTP